MFNNTFNKVTLIGRISHKPEIRHTKTGEIYCSAKIVSNTIITRANDEVEQKSTWHNLKFWGNIAEQANRKLDKGTLVYVEGKLDSYPFIKDGVEVYFTEVVVKEMITPQCISDQVPDL